MTREEAITRLNLMFQVCSFIDDRCDGECGTCDKAIDMAISALSVIDQTKWERDTALATLEEHGIGLGEVATENSCTEPSDLISRAELIKRFKTFDEKYLTLDTICDEVQSAPIVSVPQGDLISRADIPYFSQFESTGNGQYEKIEVALRSDIEALPSVSAERVGEWIKQNDELKVSDYRCSICGHYQDDKTNYCSECGARMEDKE